ncbi:MAG: VIT and VWA domain-containing protein [Candidatus Obscuribacterales bacterium]|nr:VIT and VWA domain-containing protein [Candidatus Obscuribacterales bacterium]
MKRLALSTLLSVSATTLIAPAAQASGWIMIDPIVGGVAPPMVSPPTTSPTLTPLTRPHHTPRPRPIVLQGNVSFGLHLQSEAVKVEIRDQVARTYITQTFENDTDRNLAGTYLFPLPDDTTFSSFSLHIDGKPVEGKILEANAARQEYEAIVRRMVDPGLLEYADSKTVRARIFPIPAHGTKKVELEYTQLLKAENGLLKYRFPLKTKVQDTPPEQIKVDVKLTSNQGLRTIWSPTHVISSNRSDNNNAKIGMQENDTLPDKDFLLYYSVSNTEMAANLITHKAEGEDGYFLLTLSPPFQAKSVIGKDVVLVADTSGSMQGEKMEENKRALKYVVNALHPSDRFGVVEFNTDAETFKPALVEATGENKKAACEFIDELSARGGTNIGEAISIGKTLLSGESVRPAYMIFMTDGEPTVGERDSEKLVAVANSKRDIRVFDFGIGYDINTKLLNKLAESHHGTSQYVEPDENLENALSSFYEKIKSPVLSDVKLAYDTMEVKNIYPKEVKDIFAGSQILLLGRYKKGGATKLNLTGKVNGVAKNYSFPVNFASSQAGNSHLIKLWAMRRIGYLTEIAHSNQENKEVIDEIIALSQKHGIISEYASYLVTDPSENHRLATNLPRPRRDFRAEESAQASVPAGVKRSSGWSNGFVEGRLKADKVQFAADAVGGSVWGAPATSGKKAVHEAKVLNKLKEGEVLVASNHKGVLQSIGDKTFKMIGSTWVDTSYNEHTSKPSVLLFGSQGYFDLLKAEPGISKYLSIGKELIVTYKGKTYKIVQSRNATG